MGDHEQIEERLASLERQIEERFVLLEREIETIRRRNSRVEADKAWENSLNLANLYVIWFFQ